MSVSSRDKGLEGKKGETKTAVAQKVGQAC